MCNIKRMMLGFVLVVFFCISDSYAIPLLVTQATDGVSVIDGSGSKQAPKQAFLLLDTQNLKLDEGASAVLLSEDQAGKVNGPIQIGTDFKHPEGRVQKVAEASSFLEKKSSSVNVAATRGVNDSKLLHPQPDRPIKHIKRIEISCGDCESVSYEILKMPDLELVHSFNGKPSVAYSGPVLSPGEYALQHNDNFFGFVVDTAENIQAIEKTVQATQALTSTLEDVDVLAIEAGIWFQAGYISEAFYVVEQGLQKHPNDDAFKKLYTQYYDPSNPLK